MLRRGDAGPTTAVVGASDGDLSRESCGENKAVAEFDGLAHRLVSFLSGLFRVEQIEQQTGLQFHSTMLLFPAQAQEMFESLLGLRFRA